MAVLSEEQTMLRDAAKSWVGEKSPVTALRKLRDSGNADGFDRAAWSEMAEMGWAGILIPEEFGGSGLGYLTLGLVLEETGRTLTSVLEDALRDSLARRSDNAKRKRVRLRTAGGGGLLPGVDLDDSAALLETMEP